MKCIQNITRLGQLVIQRSYSKNEDIKLLEQNGYDEDCATAYMNGYVDGLSYILSMINPEIDFEGYVNKIIDNEVTNLSVIRPGTILASKKVSDITNNLSLVLSCSRTNEGVYITTTPIVTDIGNYRWERKHDIIIEGLPTIYSKELAIDLGTMVPINMKQHDLSKITAMFSVIHEISKDQVTEIIEAYEAYDKEMGELYDAAIQKHD